MINSVNTLEFLKPKLITMDKFNSTTTSTKLFPFSTPVLPSPSSNSHTRTFVTFGNNIHYPGNNTTIDLNTKQIKQEQQTINGEIHNQHQEERVKVQHLDNHAKLQNNCWNNLRSLCNNKSASLPCINNERREHVTKYCQINNDNVLVDVIKVEQESPGINNERREHVTKYCQINNDNVVDVIKVEQESEIITATETNPITNNIQSKSAFKLDLNQIKYHNNTIYINNNNNNNNIIRNALTRTEINNSNIVDQLYLNLKQYHKQTPETSNLYVKTRTTIASPPQRTEDQNNAYRHIESVHNYAKLKSYEDDDNDDHSPHGSRHSSSYLDDDDDEDDEEDDDEEDNDDDIDEEYANGDINYDERSLELGNETYPDDLDANYENLFRRQRQRRGLQKHSTSSDGALFAKVQNSRRANVVHQKPIKFVNHHINIPQRTNDDDNEEEAHIDVDVETVESQSPAIPVAESLHVIHHHIADDSNVAVKPDHHARRPMNAFLIFCKRHRAIVKERYKNLENRAITKILGDWWASLDTNDKKCFINLAQQNKDAFFSANPDFKWYKLPAPPLRTLTIQPVTNYIGKDYQDEKDNNVLEIISNNTCNVSHNNNNSSNYFKLADEAQMGDLSQLMQEKSNVIKQECFADLQQALGETSQFMSTHIIGMSETLVENVGGLKRRVHNENSFSSNSSEEDSMEPKKKSARSCKGKRYQELINSGQIVTAVKKSKSTTRLSCFSSGEAAGKSEINSKQESFKNFNNNDSNFTNSNVCQKRSVSESDNMMSYVLNSFDLEERIKELPALDLDDYLQRKRNTKKKKKFSTNGKKRGQRSNNNNNNSVKNNNTNNSLQATQQQIPNATTHSNNKQLYQQSKTAVGSQKRKARKESITRRDISVIEQEVAPLLPLTINGCCYFQEAPTAPMKYIKPLEKDTKISETSSSIIPLLTSSTASSVDDILINNANAKIISNNNSNNNSNNDSNILNDNISSSTSDLLILAEVAANRTELKH